MHIVQHVFVPQTVAYVLSCHDLRPRTGHPRIHVSNFADLPFSSMIFPAIDLHVEDFPRFFSWSYHLNVHLEGIFTGFSSKENMFDDNVGRRSARQNCAIAGGEPVGLLRTWEEFPLVKHHFWVVKPPFSVVYIIIIIILSVEQENKNIINIVKIGTYQFVLWRLIFVDDPTVFDAQIRHHDLCCLNVVQWNFSVNLACKFLKNIGYNMVQHPSEKNITTSLRRPWNDGWRNWETIPK